MPLSVNIYAEQKVSANPFTVGKSEEGIYEVLGIIPQSFLTDYRYQSVLRGIIGHELSHIVRGDCDKKRKNFLKKIGKLPLIGKSLTRFNERAVDRETIKRGLEEELYISVRYYEEAHHLNRKDHAYSANQLQKFL